MVEKRYEETRDIAVEAKSMIDQHMTDCRQFRITVQNTLAEFRDDLKKLNWHMALIIGGITVAGKLIDLLMRK